jgi:UDP-N-acetylmuramate--alanine ligase
VTAPAAPTTVAGVVLARTHLVGAGGVGMSAIGRILLDRGWQVSGSDAKASRVLTGLDARGAVTMVGQRAENIDLLPGGPTAVVVSSAIHPDNPEVLEAHARGIPVIRRAEALAALMSGHRSVCIAGTHGKTSTTSMLTVALQHAGLDPSFAIGGELNESGSGAHAGSGDIFVAEADESDGSFLSFAPHGAVITNVEPDHLDHHGTAEAYATVFAEFVGRIAPGGFLVVGIDDVGVRSLLERVSAGGATGLPRIVSYGHSVDADVRIRHTRSTRPTRSGGVAGTDAVAGRSAVGVAAEVTVPGGAVVEIALGVPGRHMVTNATGALAAGLELGVDPQVLAEGLAGFTGVRRRFEFKGSAAGIRIYDDYAHHPTEIAATIAAARGVTGTGRLVVVFQPHLYSRTVAFADSFAAALGAADVAVVLDVYGAREDPLPGVTGQLIADAVPRGATRVRYVPSLAQAPAAVARLLRPGDVVITMGAGDVTMLGPELLAVLNRGTR